jgi:hypothetical protein
VTPAGPVILWPIVLALLWALVVGVAWTLLAAHGRRTKKR